MLFSLLVSHDLRGMTRGEIEALLGPPDPCYGGETYDLGCHSGFAIDHDVLHLEYGGDDRLRGYRVLQH